MKVSKMIVGGLLALSAAGAMAYEQGDMLVRVGATMVKPDDGATPDDVWAKGNTQLGINFVYMATNNIGIELLAATPFEHDIHLKGTGKVGTTKHLPPTLSVQYYFNKSSIVTPYLGVGLNYTTFFDENLSALGLDNIELKDSFGVAVQAGMDIALGNNWGINFDVRKISIDTEVDKKGTTVDGLKVDIDPMVYSITALYKF